MSLAAIAAADFQKILNGDGCAITLQSPDGRVANLTGFSQDIAVAIDPQTGILVSGRTCTVVVALADLDAVSMSPSGEANTKVKPWVVSYLETVSGIEHTFKVCQSNPDRTIGSLVLILESYQLSK